MMGSNERRRERSRIVRKYEGGHTGPVLCVAATEDHVFTGSLDSTVVMWERLPDRLYIKQRVDVLKQKQWCPGTIVRRKFFMRTPYGIQCDADKVGALTFAVDNDIRALPLVVGSKAVWRGEDHQDWIECVVGNVVRDNAGNVIAYHVKETDSGRTVFNANSRRVRRYVESFEMWKEEGKPMGTFEGHRGPVNCMCITHDGKGLITGSGDHTIMHWTISNQEKVRTFIGHSRRVCSVDSSGDLLVSGGQDNILIVWSISTGDRLRYLRGHKKWILCVRFSSFDGKTVFSGSRDKTVIRWKLSDGAQIMTYKGGHSRAVRSLAITRNDSMLITGSEDRTCIIWNVSSGARLHVFRGHKHWILSVALSPCERYFASGSVDKTTKVWSIFTGKQVRTLTDHDSEVHDVAFSGRHTLITASWDRTAIECDISALFKDIPARIEFLLALQTHHSEALAAIRAVPNDDPVHGSLLDFSAYVNSRPRLKGRILSFI